MVAAGIVVALVAAVHEWAPAERRVSSLLGLCLVVVAAAVLLIDYFVQATVLQPSLVKGQLDGWALLTQYNPNGVFIALEELGYRGVVDFGGISRWPGPLVEGAKP